jgi:hypothetical protein
MCSMCGSAYKDERNGPWAGPWAETDADRHSAAACLENCQRAYDHAVTTLARATRNVERAREYVRKLRSG